MKLSKKQEKALNDLVDSVQNIHELQDEDSDHYYADDKDAILYYAEQLVYSLGKVNKKIF